MTTTSPSSARDDAGSDSAAPEASLPFWRRASWPALVVVGVVVANLLPLLGIVDVSPLVPLGATGSVTQGGFLAGQWSIDPNIGYTAQALGHLAAHDWLHGVVPWWNPYEGLGAPLAAEMQSAALFPPTLLLALPQGQLLFHMVLECGAGLATWLLLRELRFGPAVATVGGLLFALDGTLAWYGSAGANPVPMLPLLLLSVERIYRRGASDVGGWLALAGGVALAVYSGFPEIVYVEGLMTATWFVFRCFSRPADGWPGFVLRVGLGVAAGLLLAAPILLPFAEYAHVAVVGVHSGSLRFAFRSSWETPVLGLPYLYGPLVVFAAHDTTGRLAFYFGRGGGYLTITAIAVGVAGLVSARRERGLRILLGVLALVLVLWVFGVDPLARVLAQVVPLTGDVNIPKYADVAFEMALVILTCFGVEALGARGPRRRTWLGPPAGALVALGVTGGALAAAWPTVRPLWDSTSSYRPYLVVVLCWSAAVLVGVTVAGLLGRFRVALWVLCGLLVLDAGAMFVFPQLSAPRSGNVDTQLVDFLSSHVGEGRFFSMGPIDRPNYGSYFGIASLDVNDLPVPNLWSTDVGDVIAPGANAKIFNGAEPDSAAQLVERLADYEAVDVRYVVVPAANYLFGAAAPYAGGLRLVYDDGFGAVYALPAPAKFYSTTNGDCSLHSSDLSSVVATCDRPATVERAELDIPGWAVTVDGRPVPLLANGEGLQEVRLPAGTSTVSFSYAPPRLDLALAAGGIGVALTAGVPLWDRWRRRRAGPAHRRRGRLRRPGTT